MCKNFLVSTGTWSVLLLWRTHALSKQQSWHPSSTMNSFCAMGVNSACLVPLTSHYLCLSFPAITPTTFPSSLVTKCHRIFDWLIWGIFPSIGKGVSCFFLLASTFFKIAIFTVSSWIKHGFMWPINTIWNCYIVWSPHFIPKLNQKLSEACSAQAEHYA